MFKTSTELQTEIYKNNLHLKGLRDVQLRGGKKLQDKIIFYMKFSMINKVMGDCESKGKAEDKHFQVVLLLKYTTVYIKIYYSPNIKELVWSKDICSFDKDHRRTSVFKEDKYIHC